SGQHVTESVVLSLMGGALCILLAYVGVRLLDVLPDSVLPHTNAIGLNLPVLAFTAVLCLVTGIGFGLLPSVTSSRQNVNKTLNEARGSSTQSRRGEIGRAHV